MSRLTPLIEQRERELEGRIKAAEIARTQLQAAQQEIDRLRRSIDQEAEACGDDLMGLSVMPAFRARTMAAIDAAQVRLRIRQQAVDDKEEAVREGFRELKALELVDAERKRKQLAKLAKAEIDQLDEVAILAHARERTDRD